MGMEVFAFKVVDRNGKRVDVGDVGCVGGHIVARAIGDLENLPPSVVGVDCHDSAIRIQYPYHVALHILLVPEPRFDALLHNFGNGNFTLHL